MSKETLPSDRRCTPLSEKAAQKWLECKICFKALQGDPHYIAKGMAIGVFVAFTPTIPFHMLAAVALSFLFRASKPAALLGAWVSNPLTIGPMYFASYKLGMALLGTASPFDIKYESLSELMTLGLDVTLVMVAGGALLGVIPAIGAYFLTRRLVTVVRVRVARRRDAKIIEKDGCPPTSA